MVRDTTDCSLQSSRLHSLSSAQLGSTELYPDGLRLGKLMTKPVCRLYQSLVLSHQNTSSTIQQHPPPTVPTPVLGSGHLRPRRRPVTSVRRQRRSPRTTQPTRRRRRAVSPLRSGPVRRRALWQVRHSAVRWMPASSEAAPCLRLFVVVRLG